MLQSDMIVQLVSMGVASSARCNIIVSDAVLREVLQELECHFCLESTDFDTCHLFIGWMWQPNFQLLQYPRLVQKKFTMLIISYIITHGLLLY